MTDTKNMPILPDAASTTPIGVAYTRTRWYASMALSALVPVPDGMRETVVHMVHLPWPLVKATHRALGELIAAYEKDEGEIHLPRSATRKEALVPRGSKGKKPGGRKAG